MKHKNGIFVISLDAELAWGNFDKGFTDAKLQDLHNTRDCITHLLNLLDKYQLFATFAFVGHLMLSKCDIQHGVKHPDLIRPNFSWYQKDWFLEDPATDITTDPLWYGADILNAIRKAKPCHEIASHSFSHIIFGDKGCSNACAESDIAECVKVAEEYGIHLTSFVFPRNSEGHKDILQKYGFSAYRGNGNEWYKFIQNIKLRQVCHYIDEFLGISPNTSIPYKDEYGLYNTVGNMLYWSRDGMRKLIPISSRIRKTKKGIDRSIKKGEVFHLWFHPLNLATDTDGLLNGLDQIFSYARMKIDSGLLENCTIKQVCEKYSK